MFALHAFGVFFRLRTCVLFAFGGLLNGVFADFAGARWQCVSTALIGNRLFLLQSHNNTTLNLGRMPPIEIRAPWHQYFA